MKIPLVRTCREFGQRSISNCFSLCAADLDFDPIIPLAVEDEGAIGWHAGTIDSPTGLTINEIPNDLNIVNFEILAC